MIFKKVTHTTCPGVEDTNCENFIQRKQLPPFKKHCPICASKTKETLGVNPIPLAGLGIVGLLAAGLSFWQFSRAADSATQLLNRLAGITGFFKSARPEAPVDTPRSQPINVDAARSGDFASIVKAGEAALKNTPSDPTLLVNVGTAWLGLGEIEKARGYLQKAITIKPNDPYIHYNLGCVDARGGNKEASVSHLKQACQLGLPPATFRQDPDLASLSGYKPFEDMIVNKMCQ